jgi:hypothetical protein
LRAFFDRVKDGPQGIPMDGLITTQSRYYHEAILQRQRQRQRQPQSSLSFGQGAQRVVNRKGQVVFNQMRGFWKPIFVNQPFRFDRHASCAGN